MKEKVSEKLNLMVKDKAAIMIQTIYRSYIARQEYNRLKVCLNTCIGLLHCIS